MDFADESLMTFYQFNPLSGEKINKTAFIENHLTDFNQTVTKRFEK